MALVIQTSIRPEKLSDLLKFIWSTQMETEFLVPGFQKLAINQTFIGTKQAKLEKPFPISFSLPIKDKEKKLVSMEKQSLISKISLMHILLPLSTQTHSETGYCFNNPQRSVTIQPCPMMAPKTYSDVLKSALHICL